MRPYIPYFTSTVVHVLALTAMAFWVPGPLRFAITIAKGKPVVSTFVAPSVSAEPTPVMIEAEEILKPQPKRPPTLAEEIAAVEVEVKKKRVETSVENAKPD